MGSRPRVLVLVKGLGLGGAERLIAEAAPYWDRRSFDYHVAYVLPWKDAFVSELEALDVPVFCIGSKRGLTPVTLRTLRRRIREDRADIVHAHLPVTGIIARIVSPVPVIYTEHNIASSYRQPTRSLNRWTYHMNTAVTAVSTEVAESLDGYSRVPIVIPNGVAASVDREVVDNIRTGLGIEQAEFLVVHVGNIRPHKGHATLIDTAYELMHLTPNARVVSIGVEKEPGLLRDLRRQAAALNLSNLEFLGARPDAREFIAAADLFVNPSDVEGLPIAILEAMMLNTPVVATDVGGVSEVVKDAETGRLVPPGRPDLLAHAVANLLKDDRLRDSLSSRAFELVRDNYDIQRMVESFESLYRDVLSV